MRIVIATGLYPPEIGGPATYSSYLERRFPTLGIDVVVVPFRRARRYWKIIRHTVYFYLVFKAVRHAELVYAQDPVSVGLPAFLAAFILRKHFVLKVVGDYAWEQATQRFGYSGTPDSFQNAQVHFFARLLRSLERFVARRAATVVVPSKYLGKLVKTWGVPASRIKVITNGIESFGETGTKQVIRGMLKFHGKLIVSVGRLVPWKGFDLLIKILPSIRRDFPETKLLIVGSGPLMKTLEDQAEAAGLRNEVIFTGALERDVLVRYVRASDVFVLNTAYEGLSHQILEVMAIGVPVITTNVGGNPEVITHGVDGYLLKQNDMKGFRETIRTVLADPALRTKLVTAGKKKVSNFSNERMADEAAALLKKICAS